MAEAMVDVGAIRFTQEHVFDSFNANSAKAGGVVELIEAILKGEKTPSDLPLIRVAAKRGAYWCVDNRRLFVYKHCQLGEIPVQVFGWKDMREFELKWRNGLSTRSRTSEGRRVGVLQRTDTPFPRSPVAEPSLSQIHCHLTPVRQRVHDRSIAKLRARREEDRPLRAPLAAGAGGAALGAASPAGENASARALRGLLLPAAAAREAADPAAAPASSARAAGARKKRRRSVEAEQAADQKEEGSDDAVAPVDSGDTKVLRKKRKKAAAAKAAVTSTHDGAAKRKKPKKAEKPAAASQPATAGAADTVETAERPHCPSAPVRLTVALAQEDSADEAYDVEVTAM